MPEEPITDEPPQKVTYILPYGVNKGRLIQAVESTRAPVEVVADISKADLLLTTKNFYRRRTQALKTAEQRGKPVYVLRKNTLPQIEQFVKAIARKQAEDGRAEEKYSAAIEEAETAITRIDEGEEQVDLNPQGSYVRHLQHKIADKYGMSSSSAGREPERRVVFYRR